MHLILFKILLLAFVPYSFPAFAQTLSQAEHCIALEEKLNIQSTWPEHYVDIYLNHFENCRPPIEYQFSFYKKLMDQLLKQEFSTSILESLNKIILHLMDQIPLDSDTEFLQKFTSENWQTLSEQRDNITFHIPPHSDYHFEKPLFITQNTQQVGDVPLNITVMSQKFSSSFSICKNTEEFQHLLKPLESFLQDLIFISSQSVTYDRLRSFQRLYTLYQSIHSPSSPSPANPQFISWMQMPPSFIEFLSSSVDWNTPPFQRDYHWFEPLLSLLKTNIRISKKIQMYCLPYQPFVNKEFIEDHYTVKFEQNHQISKDKRNEILQNIQNNLQKQDSIFFSRTYIPPENNLIYMYIIRHQISE